MLSGRLTLKFLMNVILEAKVVVHINGSQEIAQMPSALRVFPAETRLTVYCWCYILLTGPFRDNKRMPRRRRDDDKRKRRLARQSTLVTGLS